MNICIVGDAAKGLAMARQIQQKNGLPDTECSITIYEKEPFYSFGKENLPDLLPLSDEDAASWYMSHEDALREAGINAFLMTEAIFVEPSQHLLTVLDRIRRETRTVPYDVLILATGSKVQLPTSSGSERLGVHALSSFADLLYLKEYLKSPYIRDIVLDGDTPERKKAAGVFQKEGRTIRILKEEETAVSFDGGTFVNKVTTQNGTFPCDLFLSFQDSKEPSPLALQAGLSLTEDGRILTDDAGLTSCKNIYAAGSCARAG